MQHSQQQIIVVHTHTHTHTHTLIVPSALASDVCSLLVLSRFSRASSCAFCSSLLSLDSERCRAASWAWNSLRSSTYTWAENQRHQHTKYQSKNMFGTSQSALIKDLIKQSDGIRPPTDCRYISLSSLWRSKQSFKSLNRRLNKVTCWFHEQWTEAF